jgi:hypothetical protein
MTTTRFMYNYTIFVPILQQSQQDTGQAENDECDTDTLQLFECDSIYLLHGKFCDHLTLQ